MIWSPKQRVSLAIVVAALFVVLLVRFLLNRSYVSDPQEEGSRVAELPGKIDPNEATWADLAALPVIGKVLGQAIVDYRTPFVKANPGKIAFEKADDLLNVKGIGPARRRELEPYLRFPTTAPGAKTVGK